MSPIRPSQRYPRSCFPRVSGDEPLNELADQDEEAFSPRERG